ncbi:hypothetical protein F5B18DRAFT_637016 [Nemania serpens]|nr:hypothetical protein F5B18DRAFT_637016 [Nemania serpens]
MVRLAAYTALLALTVAVTATPTPRQNLPDPSLAGLKGNRNHAQSIGGECTSSNDCALATACCATFGRIGLCSGLAADFQAGKTGCGFGDAGSGSGASPSVPAVPVATAGPDAGGNGNGDGNGSGNAGNLVVVDTNAPGAANVGNGNALQFITGQCVGDADCASTCCADGKCAARAVVEAPEDPRTCGFVGRVA